MVTNMEALAKGRAAGVSGEDDEDGRSAAVSEGAAPFLALR